MKLKKTGFQPVASRYIQQKEDLYLEASQFKSRIMAYGCNPRLVIAGILGQKWEGQKFKVILVYTLIGSQPRLHETLSQPHNATSHNAAQHNTIQHNTTLLNVSMNQSWREI